MDRGLWSLGSVIIGTAGAAIGMDWTFALCGAVCAIAAITLLSVNRRYRAELARQRDIYESVTPRPDL
jgi:membrane associated rhomboid family serine protease